MGLPDLFISLEDLYELRN